METFLVDKAFMSEDDVIRIASGCLEQRVMGISKIGGGANNKVYRVTCPSQEYVVKFYFRHPLDSRDRLGIEFKSVSFLWQQGIRQIPRPIALNREHHCAFYELIKGTSLGTDISQDDIGKAAGFLEILRDLSLRPQCRDLPSASEAFFSLQDTLNSIRSRYKRIDINNDAQEYVSLHEFLTEEFIPLFESVAVWSKDYLEENGIPYDMPLSEAFRTLSPSDFGFHNALRVGEGQIVFLDFEYFGWDDPAKLVSDFLWHPGMNLSEGLKVNFVHRMERLFNNDPHFKTRLKSVFPLFGLKWCLIFLNEFIATGSDRRDFASSQTKNKTDIRLAQLAKAQAMSHKVRSVYKDFPFGI